MKRLVFLIFISSLFTYCQTNNEYYIEKIAEGFQFTEGPVWMDGNLLFSDIPENKVYQWNPEKGTEIFLDPSGNSNGLALDSEGNLLLAQHGKRRVARIVDGVETALVDTFEGKKLNSPNDMTIHSDGSIYFTDPPYGIGEDDEELGFYGIYKLTLDGEIILLDKSLVRPNGLAFSLDETKLYVADSQERKIYVWNVDENGKLSGKKLFIDMKSDKRGASDGMKMGNDGLLYATGPGGLWIIDSNGNALATIDIPGQTTNCNWGPNGEILYITSGDAVYKLKK
ncbi:MAG: SMP-30/gluconolactonase/LRE family protein [Melioribacteraceae bacterium]|nr:SMP-30/gluconolactonase/LRE family protein [Melioribacteraceae bacterium]